MKARDHHIVQFVLLEFRKKKKQWTDFGEVVAFREGFI